MTKFQNLDWTSNVDNSGRLWLQHSNGTRYGVRTAQGPGGGWHYVVDTTGLIISSRFIRFGAAVLSVLGELDAHIRFNANVEIAA